MPEDRRLARLRRRGSRVAFAVRNRLSNEAADRENRAASGSIRPTSSPSPRPEGDEASGHCQNGRARMSHIQVAGNYWQRATIPPRGRRRFTAMRKSGRIPVQALRPSRWFPAGISRALRVTMSNSPTSRSRSS